MKTVHCKKEQYDVYIGRPSIFGNLYSWKDDTLAKFKVNTIEEAIESYEVYARNNPALLEAIKELPEDSVLGCWCFDNRCHGNIIIKLWKELHLQD